MTPENDIDNDKDSALLAFLTRAADGKHRIVCSCDLIPHQISEARSDGRFFVDETTGLGWALLPWTLTTEKDRVREKGALLIQMPGVAAILFERRRQVDQEGYTAEHDDAHVHGELADAAACYAAAPERGRKWLFRFDSDDQVAWPWCEQGELQKWWKPTPNNRVRELSKAGALIAAEIERLERRATPRAVAARVVTDAPNAGAGDAIQMGPPGVEPVKRPATKPSRQEKPNAAADSRQHQPNGRRQGRSAGHARQRVRGTDASDRAGAGTDDGGSKEG